AKSLQHSLRGLSRRAAQYQPRILHCRHQSAPDLQNLRRDFAEGIYTAERDITVLSRWWRLQRFVRSTPPPTYISSRQANRALGVKGVGSGRIQIGIAQTVIYGC